MNDEEAIFSLLARYDEDTEVVAAEAAEQERFMNKRCVSSVWWAIFTVLVFAGSVVVSTLVTPWFWIMTWAFAMLAAGSIISIDVNRMSYAQIFAIHAHVQSERRTADMIRSQLAGVPDDLSGLNDD